MEEDAPDRPIDEHRRVELGIHGVHPADVDENERQHLIRGRVLRVHLDVDEPGALPILPDEGNHAEAARGDRTLDVLVVAAPQQLADAALNCGRCLHGVDDALERVGLFLLPGVLHRVIHAERDLPADRPGPTLLGGHEQAKIDHVHAPVGEVPLEVAIDNVRPLPTLVGSGGLARWHRGVDGLHERQELATITLDECLELTLRQGHDDRALLRLATGLRLCGGEVRDMPTELRENIPESGEHHRRVLLAPFECDVHNAVVTRIREDSLAIGDEVVEGVGLVIISVSGSSSTGHLL